MKYIGIRGHRGSGKITFAYLLGETITYLSNEYSSNKDINNIDMEQYDQFFNKLFNNALTYGWELLEHSQAYNVYYISFGDTPKFLVQLLLGCDYKYICNDKFKDSFLVNLKNFEIVPIETINDLKLIYSPSQAYEYFNSLAKISAINNNMYMTIRDFIVYFGREVMQKYFGINVWIKSLQADSMPIPEDENTYKIFYDVKTTSEVTYIKEHNGIIIKLDRPDHIKNSEGINNLKKDDRIDEQITIPEIKNIHSDEYEKYKLIILTLANKIIVNEISSNNSI